MKIFGPYKKRNKSASMQLSINAIVILVMAMAVLGLGLGLIRGVLGSGKDKLMNSLESMDLSEPATAEKPLTNINNLKISRNKENTVVAGFYNVGSDCVGDNSAYLQIKCSKNQVPVNWTSFDYAPVSVGQGESKKVGAILKTAVSAGNYPCTIEIHCGDAIAVSESAFISINS